jgi:hypothetical protein
MSGEIASRGSSKGMAIEGSSITRRSGGMLDRRDKCL